MLSPVLPDLRIHIFFTIPEKVLVDAESWRCPREVGPHGRTNKTGAKARANYTPLLVSTAGPLDPYYKGTLAGYSGCWAGMLAFLLVIGTG